MRRHRQYWFLMSALVCFLVTAFISFSEKDIQTITLIRYVDEVLSNQQEDDRTNKQTTIPSTQLKKINDDIERRFQQRKEVMHKACARYKNQLRYSRCERQNADFNLKYVNNSNLVYCAIEKTGSTLWKRILHVIGGWGNDSNPTSIKSEDADIKSGGFQTLTNTTMPEKRDIFNNSASIMFVRDPYSRLFSAWLDKLYSPNYYYWSSLGPAIVRRLRYSEEESESAPVTCASDVSFAEFINYTLGEVTANLCVDGHFSPSHKHCLPCILKHDYIGKYETFKEDTRYLLKKLNLTQKVTFADFEKDGVWDAIRDSTEFLFSQNEKISKCNVTFYCALFKVWNRLQSRGILSNMLDFPFENTDDVDNVTKADVVRILTYASRKSNMSETKGNRMEALHQAYQLLPWKLIQRLVRTFRLDFNMFGYDRYPEYINQTQHASFKYFKNCEE